MEQKGKKGWLRTVFVLLVCMVLSSCAAIRQGQQERGDGFFPELGRSFGRGADAATKGEKGAFLGLFFGTTAGGLEAGQVVPYMDSQEEELKQVLVTSSEVSLNRKGDTIVVSFEGDTHFDTGKYAINPQMRATLDRIATALRNHPKTWIEVGGYADPRGSKQENFQLSQYRANVVYDALVQRGVNTARLKAVGFGEEAAGKSGSHKADRKVVLKLQPMRKSK